MQVTARWSYNVAHSQAFLLSIYLCRGHHSDPPFLSSSSATTTPQFATILLELLNFNYEISLFFAFLLRAVLAVTPSSIPYYIHSSVIFITAMAPCPQNQQNKYSPALLLLQTSFHLILETFFNPKAGTNRIILFIYSHHGSLPVL